jgi:hypothetical protein
MIPPAGSDSVLRPILGGMSIFTMLMTIPQVLTIWVSGQAAGVSVLSWGAYLVSAILWFWFGITEKRQEHLFALCGLDRAGWRCDCGGYRLRLEHEYRHQCSRFSTAR